MSLLYFREVEEFLFFLPLLRFFHFLEIFSQLKGEDEKGWERRGEGNEGRKGKGRVGEEMD